ncbi:MAG: DUF2062 domain-containing protein [Synechococcales cyanobacterium RU_4_20]|nr:DUF2062 domain-containing protein [Synechococcales cyanobacterium RU_4_20]NJR67682.1 DUF2062 domain-containing protein [Synechococcales cyanobacterium CRU_2_2]
MAPLQRQRPKLDWERRLRYFYYRFVRLHSSPDYLARGLAIGVFAGFLPFFGLQVVLSVAIASLLRGHRVVAAAATWISNPLTYIPLYSLAFRLGCWVLGRETIVFNTDIIYNSGAVLALGKEFAITLLTGCVLMGVSFSVLSYFAALYLLKRSRRRGALRRHSVSGDKWDSWKKK